MLYTKTGDKGMTSLFGNKRTLKSDLQVEAYGTVDELTSFLGLLIVKLKSDQEKTFFTRIQKDLYCIMSVLSGAKEDLKKLDEEVGKIEKTIDQVQSKLPRLNRFILPNGTEISSLLHVVRVVCRRAERNVVKYFSANKIGKNQESEIILKYLNRLSDLFFAKARTYNKNHEVLV